MTNQRQCDHRRWPEANVGQQYRKGPDHLVHQMLRVLATMLLVHQMLTVPATMLVHQMLTVSSTMVLSTPDVNSTRNKCYLVIFIVHAPVPYNKNVLIICGLHFDELTEY